MSELAAPARRASSSPAVTRAADILDAVAGERAPLGISALARRLGLPKSSVANLCSALAEANMLRVVDGGYALGWRLAELGAAYLTGVDQVQLFHEYCAGLDAARGETVQLALLGDGLDVTYLARRDGSYPVRLASAPGRALPATCTATGKAMLAGLGDDDLHDRVLRAGTLPRLTGRSVRTERQLRSALATVRRQGYAIDDEEVIEGVVCVAAAIEPATEESPRLAVSITLLKPRATPDTISALAAEVRSLAENIARALGASHLSR